jgi:hypothetical protein
MASTLNTKILLLLFFLLINFPILEAQSTTNGLSVSRGLAVSFFFDSSAKLSGGVTYSNFGQFLITNTSADVDSAIWEIVVYADAMFDYGMPLDVVEIRADAGVNGISTGWQKLSLAPVTLLNTGQKGIKMPVNFSYRVGTDPIYRVSGYPVGYYRLNLHYKIYFSPI